MAERVLDFAALAAAIERRFPQLSPVRSLRVLGRGVRSLAVETADGNVLKVGRSPDASDDYAREWITGRFLSGQLGSVVPEPAWYTPPCEEFPHGALGYRKLPGSVPHRGIDPGARFARELGYFMARLHALPVDAALAAGVPSVDARSRVLGARQVVMPVLASRLPPDLLDVIEAWWSAFARDERMRTDRIAVCHHDLWHDNLLRSTSGALSGVLDLAHVEVGDPAHDFAAPRHFGERFMSALQAGYRRFGGSFDEDDGYRARRYWEAREFGGLAWAVEHDDHEEIESGIEKVLNGPILASARAAASRELPTLEEGRDGGMA